MNAFISEFFKNKTVSEEKLAEFGFTALNGVFVYETYLQNGQMRLTVTVNASGEISANVYDCETDEEYTLFLIENAVGGFVGEVREAVAEVLAEIAEKCCYNEVFKNQASKALLSYARNTYGDELEFLWKNSTITPSSAEKIRENGTEFSVKYPKTNWDCPPMKLSKSPFSAFLPTNSKTR